MNCTLCSHVWKAVLQISGHWYPPPWNQVIPKHKYELLKIETFLDTHFWPATVLPGHHRQIQASENTGIWYFHNMILFFFYFSVLWLAAKLLAPTSIIISTTLAHSQTNTSCHHFCSENADIAIMVVVAFSLEDFEDFMCSRKLAIEKSDKDLEISWLIFDLSVLQEAWFK